MTLITNDTPPSDLLQRSAVVWVTTLLCMIFGIRSDDTVCCYNNRFHRQFYGVSSPLWAMVLINHAWLLKHSHGIFDPLVNRIGVTLFQRIRSTMAWLYMIEFRALRNKQNTLTTTRVPRDIMVPFVDSRQESESHFDEIAFAPHLRF